MMFMNGKRVAADTQAIQITQAEYEALSETDRMDPDKIYLVSDSTAEDYQKLLKLLEVVGSTDDLSGIADGTIIGAIKDIYDRLGGLSFQFDTTDNYLQATYSDEVTPAVVTTPTNYLTDAAKIEHMREVVGNQDDLSATGFSTVVGAIVDIYRRLDGLSFAYDANTETVAVSVETEE